jgi:hypothetical protein
LVRAPTPRAESRSRRGAFFHDHHLEKSGFEIRGDQPDLINLI